MVLLLSSLLLLALLFLITFLYALLKIAKLSEARARQEALYMKKVGKNGYDE